MTKNQYKKLMQNELVWALYEDLMYEGNVQEWNEILKKPIKEIIKIAEKESA
jgi:sulfur transfer complex TusBCD TusB component (DsrH family)|tara:strand:+ start:460 stop:615 length:156 start_codon:yes stop_codon:yes gene_type:complete